PAGGGGSLVACRLLEEDADRAGAGAERRGDAGREAVAHGRADDQRRARLAVGELQLAREVGLPLDLARRAHRVGRRADEAADLGFDDHGWGLMTIRS